MNRVIKSKQISQNTHFSPTSQTQNMVLIHVCDESKKTTQDFRCERSLLLSSMKYFEKYLCDQKSLDDIDISVHCDVTIFDWLMKYVHD